MNSVTRVARPPDKPLLIFDGDCAFCRCWIARWKQTTGESVDYIPFQDESISSQFPELSRDQLESAVHLIEPDGRVTYAAEAVFRSLVVARPWPLRAYENLPAFAPVSEFAYRIVARQRASFSLITRWLWGRHVEQPTHVLVRWLFLRLIGLTYFIAFLSLNVQLPGLIGTNGIMPAGQIMRAVEQNTGGLGLDRFRVAPTVCWFSAEDDFLRGLCVAGVALSVLVVLNIAPAPCLFLLWLLYLSLAQVSTVFLGYQWDNLLLETGLLAIFFAPLRLWPNLARESPPPRVVLWLLRWLLFRLMFSSGLVKLLSGDATWHNLTALTFHYETQPLATPLAWYAHQLPLWFHKVSCAGMFFVELALPFLIFLPRRPRFLACYAFVVLMVGIALTGNYTFFNLLTIALCVALLDDVALARLVPQKYRHKISSLAVGSPANGGVGKSPFHEARHSLPPSLSPSGGEAAWRAGEGDGRFKGANPQSADSSKTSPPYPVLAVLVRWSRTAALTALTAVVLGVTTVEMLGMMRVRWSPEHPLLKLYEWVAPFRSINGYGLFAVMTTSRPEIIVEGSNDGQTWLAYEFRHKPGDLRRPPTFIAPHQPRLDWQMWFAALGDVRGNRWFVNFCVRLLQSQPEVVALIKKNPFPDRPPKFIRARLYDYHFTTSAERRKDGTWWRREYKGEYCPTLSLPENSRP